MLEHHPLACTRVGGSRQARAQRRMRSIALVLALAGSGAAALAQVGLASLELSGVPTTLTYPTDQPTRRVMQGPFELEIAPDAPPRDGRHRLVVMSHGTGGSALADQALAQSLARAGFVVAQPLHAGDNYRDTRDAGPVAFERRPSEVIQVIDALAAHPIWSSRLTLDRVGVHGMSAGGVTALSLAGAQWRTLDLVRHCNRVGEADAGFCFNGAVTPERRAARQAQYSRARWVPDLLLPGELKLLKGGRSPGDGSPEVRPDTRVAAISLMVPVAAIFTPDSLSRIAIPLGVVSAAADQVLVPQYHADHVMRHCRTCVRLADLAGAGHFDVLWPWPAGVAREVAQAQARGGTPNPAFDPRARDAAHQRIVQFHLRHLMQSAP